MYCRRNPYTNPPLDPRLPTIMTLGNLAPGLTTAQSAGADLTARGGSILDDVKDLPIFGTADKPWMFNAKTQKTSPPPIYGTATTQHSASSPNPLIVSLKKVAPYALAASAIYLGIKVVAKAYR